MLRSLYWKICATFLAVVLLSVAAGSLAFSLVANHLLDALRRDTVLSVARLGVREIERFYASGGTPDRLEAHLAELLADFPHVTVLHATPDGRIHGRLEPGRDVLRRRLEEAAGSGLARTGYRLWPAGPGRGAAVVLPVGPGGRLGWALLAARGGLDEVRPAALGASATSLAVVFLTAAALGLLVFRVVARRLGRVRDALRGVSDGDLSRRVSDATPDEIGDLGRSFDQMAERLEAVVRELSDADRRRRQFLADVSHELKTPLTALRGRLEQLLSSTGTGTGTSAPGAEPRELAVAFEEVDRLGLLIEDLLELARLDSTEFSLRREESVLQRIAARALDRFTLAVANRGVHVVRRLSPEPVRRQVDARRLEQVVSNLLANAIRSVDAGGTVEIAVDQIDGRAVLEVADDGPGISPEEMSRIFDRFYTADGGGGGTGLGLSIVRRLVEAHGGTIRIERRGPRGTRAVVEIP
jgi:two-component system OmpR family sensor kinase